MQNKTPLYLRIKRYLLEGMEAGVWPANGRLPSEEALCGQFSVARGTVRQAVQELAAEGRIYSVRGKGTFAAPARMVHRLDNRLLVSYLDELEEQHVPFTTEVLEQSVIEPPDAIRQRLARDTRQVFFLRRLRRSGGITLMLADNYVPIERFAGIDARDYTRESLYGVMREAYACPVDYANRTFRAVAADGNLANLARVAEGFPLMRVEQIDYDVAGQCVNIANIWINSDVITLSTTVTRGGEGNANAGRL